MLDVEFSFNEGSEEVLKDFNDEPVMKTRIFYSNDAPDNKPDIEAMGMYLRSPLSLPFLIFLLFPFLYPLICLACFLVMH